MLPEKYLALLRGINVGGKNIIRMTELKACFESLGFSDVLTYIQSGNVIFSSAESNKGALTGLIEKALSTTFSYDSRIVLISHKQLKEAVNKAPQAFGKDPDKFKYDVVFLKAPVTAKEAIKQVRVRDGIETAYPGKGVLYFSRLISKAGQGQLVKIISLPVYQSMTIRNWKTTTKLFALMQA